VSRVTYPYQEGNISLLFRLELYEPYSSPSKTRSETKGCLTSMAYSALKWTG
jgi:hypothetical protein